MTLEPGQTLANGKYRLVAPIGQGAMGEVWRAEHVALGRPVALKMLRADIGGDENAAKRLRREAMAASRLTHKNSTQVLDFGQSDGSFFIVMELLEGESLFDVLAREGLVTEHRAIQLMGQALAALAAAHDEGIIHRDIKPENIMIVRERDDEGQQVELVKVCDFGIAKLTGDGTGGIDTPALTEVGSVIGTPCYMAPEQARDLPLDARTDLYSVGVVLYRMVVGRPPFEAENDFAVLMSHVMDVPTPPRTFNETLNPETEKVILRAMSKKPDQRFQSARDMRRALLAIDVSASGNTIDEAVPAFANTVDSDDMRREFGQAETLASSSALDIPAVPAASPLSGTARGVPKRQPSMPRTTTPATAEAAASERRLLTRLGLGAVVIFGILTAVFLGMRGGGDAAKTDASAAGPENAPAAVVKPDTPPVGGSSTAPAGEGGAKPTIPAPAPEAPTAAAAKPAVVDANPTPEGKPEAADAVPLPSPAPLPAIATRAVVTDASVSSRRALEIEATLPAPADKAPTEVPKKPKTDRNKPKSVASVKKQPKKPVEAPKKPAEQPKAPVEAPKAPVESPKAPVEAPKAPVEQPKAPVEQPKAPSLDASVGVSGVSVQGDVPVSTVSRSLSRESGAFRECYRTAAKAAGKDKSGTAKVSFVLDEYGRARKVSVSGAPFSSMNGCISKTVGRVRTRIRPDTGLPRVSVRIRFSPK